METATQQPRTTRPQPMESFYQSDKPLRAIRADNSFFRTITARRVTMTRPHKNAALETADPNAETSAYNEVVQNDKHAGTSQRQARSTSRETGSCIRTISRE